MLYYLNDPETARLLQEDGITVLPIPNQDKATVLRKTTLEDGTVSEVVLGNILCFGESPFKCVAILELHEILGLERTLSGK